MGLIVDKRNPGFWKYQRWKYSYTNFSGSKRHKQTYKLPLFSLSIWLLEVHLQSIQISITIFVGRICRIYQTLSIVPFPTKNFIWCIEFCKSQNIDDVFLVTADPCITNISRKYCKKNLKMNTPKNLSYN